MLIYICICIYLILCTKKLKSSTYFLYTFVASSFSESIFEFLIYISAKPQQLINCDKSCLFVHAHFKSKKEEYSYYCFLENQNICFFIFVFIFESKKKRKEMLVC